MYRKSPIQNAQVGSELLWDLFGYHVPIQGNFLGDRGIWEGIFPHFVTYCDCVTYHGQGKKKDLACIFFLHAQYTQNLGQLVIVSRVPLSLSWPFKLLHAWDQSLWFWNTLLHPSTFPGETVQNNWRGLIQTSQTDVGERFPPTQSSSDWNLSCPYRRWPFPFVRHVNLLFKYIPFS